MQRSSFSEVLDEQLTQLRSLLVREHEEESQLRTEQQELELERLRIRVRQLEAHVEKAQLSLDLVKPAALRKRSEGDGSPHAAAGHQLDAGHSSSTDNLSVVPLPPAPLPNVIDPPSDGPVHPSFGFWGPILSDGPTHMSEDETDLRGSGQSYTFANTGSLEQDARLSNKSVEFDISSMEAGASRGRDKRSSGRLSSKGSVTEETCSDSWSSSSLGGGEAMQHVKTEPSIRVTERDSGSGVSSLQVKDMRTSEVKDIITKKSSNLKDSLKIEDSTSQVDFRRSILGPLHLFEESQAEKVNGATPFLPEVFAEPTMAALGAQQKLRRSWSHGNKGASKRPAGGRLSGGLKRLSGAARTSVKSNPSKIKRGSLKSKKGGLMRAFSGAKFNESKASPATRAGHALDGVLTSMGNAVRSFGRGPPSRRPEDIANFQVVPSLNSGESHRSKDLQPSGRGKDADAGGEEEINHFELLELHPVWKVERRHTQNRPSHIFRGTTQMFRFKNNPGKQLEQVQELPQGEACLSKLIIHPHCVPRITWDWIGFLLIVYDVIMVPLQIFEPERDTVLEYFEWIARFYWSLDILVNFFTGYLEDDGSVCKAWSEVAWRYARSWLILDIAVVILVWLEVTSDSMSEARVLKGIRGSRGTLRILRAVRLLRLLRMENKSQYILRSLSFLVRSEELMIVLGIVKIMCIIGMLVHLIACFWYGVGLLGADDSSTGWLVENDMKRESLGFRYVTSYHWSLAQFTGSDSITPGSHIERAFAVVTLFPAFVISACVVSSITTSMTQLQILSAHSSRQLTQLHRYLQDHGISATLATRVQRNAQHFIQEQKRNTPESSVELLTVLSQPLRVELAYEVHGPVLQWHPFFRVYNRMSPAGLRQICHAAVQRLFLTKDDVLFNDGEMPAQPRMFFLVTGELAYKRKGRTPEYVEAGEWISEPVLWTLSWFHHGGMSASTECNLLCLIADQFQQITKQFMTGPNFQPGMYAQMYLQCLNRVADDNRKEVYCEDYMDVSEISSKFVSE